MLSNVAVFSAAVLCDDTARPTYTVLPMPIVVTPTCVHVTPSADRYDVIVVPARTSFTHTGALMPAFDVLVDPPAVVVRRMKLTPFSGVTKRLACLAFAASDSRIMTPAFA